MGRAFELRADAGADDACYVALAEHLDCELLTADGRLATPVGPRCATASCARAQPADRRSS